MSAEVKPWQRIACTNGVVGDLPRRCFDSLVGGFAHTWLELQHVGFERDEQQVDEQHEVVATFLLQQLCRLQQAGLSTLASTYAGGVTPFSRAQASFSAFE